MKRLLVVALVLMGCGHMGHLRRHAADVIERRRAGIQADLAGAKDVLDNPSASTQEQLRARIAVGEALDSAERMRGWTAPLVKDMGEVKPEDQLQLWTDEEKELAETYQASADAKVFNQDWWKRLVWNPVATFLKDTAWDLGLRWGPWVFVLTTLLAWWRKRVNRKAALQGEEIIEAAKRGKAIRDAIAEAGGKELARLHVVQKVRRAKCQPTNTGAPDAGHSLRVSTG